MSNTPNYQGMFLRGYGAQNFSQDNGASIGYTNTEYESGGLGQVQGDGIRATGVVGEFMGSNPSDLYTGNSANTRGMVQHIASVHGYQDLGARKYRDRSLYRINMGNAMPTANEIRPVNIAVKYLIRANN